MLRQLHIIQCSVAPATKLKEEKNTFDRKWKLSITDPNGSYFTSTKNYTTNKININCACPEHMNQHKIYKV